MNFIEIAPDYFINADRVIQFKLTRSENRGGWCWVFTLSDGKILFSIPFKSEEEAQLWLRERLENLKNLSGELKEKHKNYKPD
jgi:hypothetical protein